MTGSLFSILLTAGLVSAELPCYAVGQLHEFALVLLLEMNRSGHLLPVECCSSGFPQVQHVATPLPFWPLPLPLPL